MDEKRSATPAGAQLDWVDLVHGQGVGARHSTVTAPPGGGGYLDECTPSQLWADARLRELADMGLPRAWLEIAHELGYEPFMQMWRRLDAAVEMRSEAESMIEVQLRRYSSFQRYQRNRFIEALADMGLTGRQIRERVSVEIGENLSVSHIRRIVKPRRVKP